MEDSPFGQAYSKVTGANQTQADPNPFTTAYSKLTGVDNSNVDTTPATVAQARQYIGQQSYNGLCQKFAEAITDHKVGEYPSAVAAFNTYATNKQAYQGIDGAKPGDLVYFSPNSGNGNFGHVGIYSGDGKFISATDNGVQELPINNWLKQTGQQLLGYVPK